MRSRMLPLFATLAVFLVFYLIGFQRFEAFGTTKVILNILTDKAFLGVTAIGMTFVILSGGIDLSVGSVVAFTGVFCALMIQETNLHPLIVFAIVLIMGAVFGATMGAIIHYLEIPPFIITLAGMFLARGAAFVLSEASIPVEHEFYSQVSSVFLRFPDKGRLTVVAMIFIIVTLLAILVAHFTRFGRNVYAMGGDPTSALLLGVPAGETTIAVYTLSSVMATLGGIIYSLYTRSGYPLAAQGLELDAIAAVVIGGTLLTGGVGYVAGTFVAVGILGTIQTYINFDGTLNAWWTRIVIGVLVFVAIALQKIFSSRRQNLFKFLGRWQDFRSRASAQT